MLKLFLLVCFSLNVLVASIPLDKSEIEGRLWGGNATDISEVPHQVALFHLQSFECGGFIVSPNYIVTSGQCVKGIGNKRMSFRIGSSSNKEGGVIVKAKNVYRHPKYDSDSPDYNVAVVELATPIVFNNKTIKPIKLTTKEPAANSAVLISGWGGFIEPETLQSATYSIFDRTKCAAMYKTHNITLTPRMICTGAERKDIYYGDGGGAAVYKGEAVGIVFYGAGWYIKDLPGVCTNIADPEINKFIRDIAKL